MSAEFLSDVEIAFITRNKHKFEEAKYVLSLMGVRLIQVPMKRIEIQSDDLCEIALFGVKDAAEKLNRPVIVEDAGLFIESLGGFPGPYSSYVFKTIGLSGILKLMRGVSDRRAWFESAVAYCDSSGECRVFKGVAFGEIALEPRGSGGFGFDPIFIPDEGDGLTFAEMEFEHKCRISHRAKAFKAFGMWLASHLAK
ncbi:MAG: XTP/dITP diphosphatase [archaeon GB-1867-005]|nr:XTP/dITP diphosphatase [Candidatus Culexmicrobium cathedralense]